MKMVRRGWQDSPIAQAFQRTIISIYVSVLLREETSSFKIGPTGQRGSADILPGALSPKKEVRVKNTFSQEGGTREKHWEDISSGHALQRHLYEPTKMC